MVENLAISRGPYYDLADPMELSASDDIDPLLLQLVATRAFQRLKSIRFLGGIDYVLVRSPNGTKGNIRYTRYQHSLGVAKLAIFYCNFAALSIADRRLVCAAALLHDIGHAPLSHSLEPVFKEVFGLAHHRATEDIVTGRVPIGVEVYDALRDNKVDIERMIAVMTGEETGCHGFFSGPINFDTIEGILRAQAYTRPNPNMLSPVAVTEAAIRRFDDRDRRAVDEFWLYKDQVYRHVINSRVGVLADFACQFFMRRHLDEVTPEDYFVTEAYIFRKLRGLRDLLTSRSFEAQILSQFSGAISYTARHFYIDQNADFFARDDAGRYRQSKELRMLFARRNQAVDAVGLTRDLFDDYSD